APISTDHEYGAGTYTARFTATDRLGLTTSVDQTVVANAAPTASLNATPTSGTAPLNVHFDGTGTDPDGRITEYRLSFGDGSADVTSSSSISTNHTYGAGLWTAVLTVTDDGGAQATSRVDIDANAPPTARLSASPTTGKAPLKVTLVGGGSDADGRVVQYRLAFGDGSPDLVTTLPPSVVHQYRAGTWTAILTVTDDRGATGKAGVTVIATKAGR